MPASPGQSPVVAIDSASGAIADSYCADSVTPRRPKLAIRPPSLRCKRPPRSPTTILTLAAPKRTRYQPDLTVCHACKLRTTTGKPLHPLPSQWRVALLCPNCFPAIRTGVSCSYCFSPFGSTDVQPAIDVVRCRRCHCRVHSVCVPRMRGYASLQHDLDPQRFTCVDCAAVPDFFRVGFSAINRVSLEKLERFSPFATAEKAVEVACAESRPNHKTEVAACAAVVLERELFKPGMDGDVTPSMEIDRTSCSGDAEEVQGAEVIDHLGNGNCCRCPQKPPLLTYSRRRCDLGRSGEKALFVVTYTFKRNKALRMGKDRTPAAIGQESFSRDDQLRRGEGEFDREESGVLNRFGKTYFRRRPRSETSGEENELEEKDDDKKGHAGCKRLAPSTNLRHLRTYLRRRYMLVSSEDEGKPVGIQSEQKPEQPSASGRLSSNEAPDMPDHYLKKYCRKVHSDGVDEAKTQRNSSPDVPDRYAIKYSRKPRLGSHAENEQVLPGSGLGNGWRLRRCTANRNGDAPQEPGGLALDAAHVNVSFCH